MLQITCEKIAGYIVEYNSPYDQSHEEEHFHSEEEMLAFCATLKENYSVFKIIRCIIEE